MYQLFATLHALTTRLTQTARQRLRKEPERGSVTMEQVIWAVAVIAIAGIVVAAVRAYVTTQAGLLK